MATQTCRGSEHPNCGRGGWQIAPLRDETTCPHRCAWTNHVHPSRLRLPAPPPRCDRAATIRGAPTAVIGRRRSASAGRCGWRPPPPLGVRGGNAPRGIHGDARAGAARRRDKVGAGARGLAHGVPPRGGGSTGGLLRAAPRGVPRPPIDGRGGAAGAERCRHRRWPPPRGRGCPAGRPPQRRTCQLARPHMVDVCRSSAHDPPLGGLVAGAPSGGCRWRASGTPLRVNRAVLVVPTCAPGTYEVGAPWDNKHTRQPEAVHPNGVARGTRIAGKPTVVAPPPAPARGPRGTAAAHARRRHCLSAVVKRAEPLAVCIGAPARPHCRRQLGLSHGGRR